MGSIFDGFCGGVGAKEWVLWLLRATLGWFLRRPLYHLYMNGPEFMHCLAGRPLPEVCADMTHVPVGHWEVNLLECAAMVDKRFEAFFVAVTTVLYLACLLKLLLGVFGRLVDAVTRRNHGSLTPRTLHKLTRVLQGSAALHVTIQPVGETPGAGCEPTKQSIHGA